MKKDPQNSWLFRFLGLGLQMVAFICVGFGGGLWIDHSLGNQSKIATVFGALIGCLAGMIYVVREALKKPK